MMSETNNFQINLLAKNSVVYSCKILSEQNNKNRSKNLLEEWLNQFTDKCTGENLMKIIHPKIH